MSRRNVQSFTTHKVTDRNKSLALIYFSSPQDNYWYVKVQKYKHICAGWKIEIIRI